MVNLATDLSDVPLEDIVSELTRRRGLPRCSCRRWMTYLGAYDRDGYTLRCFGCNRSTGACRCG